MVKKKRKRKMFFYGRDTYLSMDGKMILYLEFVLKCCRERKGLINVKMGW